MVVSQLEVGTRGADAANPLSGLVGPGIADPLEIKGNFAGWLQVAR
jgi:hypothetical protein